MAITRIKVSNFKSFHELEVDLRPLNIVVGANAAGKSNFLEIFRFLRDLAAHGLENAVSLQGGMEYLANVGLGAAMPVVLELTQKRMAGIWFQGRSSQSLDLGMSAEGITHRISLRQTPSGLSVDERVIFHGNFETNDLNGMPVDRVTGSLTVVSSGGSVRYEALDRDLGALLAKVDPGPPRAELIRSYLPSDIAVFDLDPKLSKKAVPISGKVDFEPDGSNLAIVLRRILQSDKESKILVSILKDLLPFVDDLRVERFSDKSLLISLKERFSEASYLPASFLSDGTIHLIALILALYFEKAGVTVIEEPERNVHPHLISKIAAMMKDASQQKQIIATTHNPEMVRNADLEDLLLIHRDEDGFSRVSRPAENRELKVFLENDLGMDELYVQNLLA